MRNELDELLKHALIPTEEPDARLNQSIVNQVKEREIMKRRIWKRIPAAALAAAIVIGCASVTVAAGVVVRQYLSVQDAVKRTEDTKLLDAFLSEDAVLINETQSYGGYDVTLLGIVSGKNISDFVGSHNGVPMEDRTYVMVAIANSDGTPFPEMMCDLPDDVSFYISPLVRDFTPAFFNTYTLGGGGQGFSENGVIYWIVQCDNVEIFADHGLYVCVSDGSAGILEQYHFDEETGIISRNEDYKGLNALFDLPIDSSKADPEAAENYLKSNEMFAEKFLGIQSEEEENEPDLEQADFEDKDKWRHQITPGNIDMYADRLEDSVQVLTPDEKGYITYKYEGADGSITSGGNTHLDESSWKYGEGGFLILGFGVSGEGKSKTAFIDTVQKNEDGTITYACYRVKQSVLESE